jgi:hypothetical protein
MAALVVTGRRICSHGNTKREVGTFTSSAWDASEWLKTKLSYVKFFKLQSVDGTADAQYVVLKNAGSGGASDSGAVNMVAGGQNSTYVYEAVGK